ncbi:MAG: prepilin peptidase [Candidatus Cloacimonadaceae bacterium]|nr:prepilin peptidase [Candidatus Cloacimonadota bacterium]MDD5624427.1 prepilin peptidase [Candidatus Cloacimonadota bacterium]MDY0112368.1 prepilin peptidase [Candidatus Syntrophosphaera sp.]
MTALIIILLFVIGACLGSFFNVLIDRIPRHQSIIRPASHCTECGKSIPFSQNIPIISYILLKGRCKSCGAKIHWHHLVVEIITPVLFIALYLVYGLSFSFFKFAIMTGFLIPIFFIDAFHKIIPLVLSIPLAITGLLLGLIQTDFNFYDFFMVFFLPVVILFAFLYLLALLWLKLFHREGLGGGDVILIPAVGAFFGIIHIPWVILFACILGLLYFLIFVRKPNQGFAFGNIIALASYVWTLIGDKFLQAIGWFHLS